MNINRKENKPNFILGNMELEYTDRYRYLGFIQNTKNNMKTYVHTIKGKQK